jgi:hypothetical protein
VLLIGAITVTIGGGLFLNLTHNEPLWAEWFLGPALVYVGLPIAIIGIALHFYRSGEHSAGATNAHR